MTALRGHTPSSLGASGPYSSGSGTGDEDLQAWRPDPWDRDYYHRFRSNNTRVQRESVVKLI